MSLILRHLKMQGPIKMVKENIDINRQTKGKIIGRWEEKALLKELFDSKKAEFMVI